MTAAIIGLETSRTATFRKEEAIGLVLALAAHAGLVAAILLRPPPEAPPLEQRVTVTLADDVGLTATSPDALAQAAPGMSAPLAAEPEPEPEPLPPPPKPEPVLREKPKPLPRITPKPLHTPRATATPQRRVTATPNPRVTRTPNATRTPNPRRTDRPNATGTPNPQRTRTFDDAFGEMGKGDKGGGGSPVFGPRERASLLAAVSREIKPNWTAPQGVEVERLVTFVTWDLNADGSLKGQPRIARQEGITPANRPQAARHGELALRAITRAAPFDLPPQFYNHWKRVIEFRFDRKLSE